MKYMGLSYYNANEVEDIAKDIKTYANDFISEINNLYKRLSEVPNVTKEWVGNKANFYFDTISNDKSVYIDFGNKLYKIGETLSNDIEDIQNTMKENKDNEEEVL